MEQVTVIHGSRTVLLNGEINDDTAASVCKALLELEAEDSSSHITLMINSGGGSVSAGWMIIDTLRLIDTVETICIGQACSMAALILAAGKKGCRSILPHSKVMIHQPLASAAMQQAADFEIAFHELGRTKSELYQFLANATGKSYAQIEADCDRNYWLSSTEAVEYGLVDFVETPATRTGGIYPAGNV